MTTYQRIKSSAVVLPFCPSLQSENVNEKVLYTKPDKLGIELGVGSEGGVAVYDRLDKFGDQK